MEILVEAFLAFVMRAAWPVSVDGSDVVLMIVGGKMMMLRSSMKGYVGRANSGTERLGYY